ncbi:MAG: iron-sulfur cluster assembly scaffold protein [Verrucomicrobiales bacterium]
MSESSEDRINEAIRNPRNMGEMSDADAVGTVGSPECGDMVRMWLKFKEDDQGRKVIDRASFQSFGCQTAIAVASVATEMLAGRSVDEALAMKSDELSKPLGPLPPMKIHCGQMVEGALREALSTGAASGKPGGVPAETAEPEPTGHAASLAEAFHPSPAPTGRMRIVKLEE